MNSCNFLYLISSRFILKQLLKFWAQKQVCPVISTKHCSAWSQQVLIRSSVWTGVVLCFMFFPWCKLILR